MPDPSSLYPSAPQQNQGLLSGDTYKLIGTLQGMQQFNLLSKNIAAKEAIGNAYSKNLNPDGTPNIEGIAGDLRNNAAAAFGLPEVASTLLEQHGKKITNDTASFDQYAKQSGFVQQWIASRAAQVQAGQKLTPEEIRNDAVAMSRNIDPRILPSSVINSVVDSVVNDPKGIGNAIINLKNRVVGANQGRVAAPPDQVGAPQTMPAAAAEYGASPQSARSPGTVTTALPPGVGEGAVATGTKSGIKYAEDLDRNANYTREIYPLTQAIPALERLGPQGSGPGKDEINQIKSAAISFGFAPENWTGSVKDFDEAKKYMTDWVNANTTGGTNDRLAAAFSSNASTKISQAAAVDVMKAAASIRRMQKMQTDAFAQTGLPDSEYTKWASKWNAMQDPRAYGFDLMTPAQRTSVLKGLPPAKRDLFMINVQRAEDAGILNAPSK